MYRKRKPEAIFFDWDGTIVDNNDFVKGLSGALLQHFPLQGHEKPEDFQKVINMSFIGGATARDAMAYLYDKTDYDIDEMLLFLKQKSREFTPKIAILDGVVDLIRQIYDAKIDMCVISNRDSVSLKKEADEIGLSQYFKHVISFDCIDKPKPLPDLIYHALSLLGKGDHDAQHCWMIGDTISDVGCAINSGAVPFFVGSDEKMTAECQEKIQNGEVIRINKYQEIGDIIDMFTSLKS